MKESYKGSRFDHFIVFVFIGGLLLIWHILLHFHLLDMVR